MLFWQMAFGEGAQIWQILSPLMWYNYNGEIFAKRCAPANFCLAQGW
jgi:hypothetical protein